MELCGNTVKFGPEDMPFVARFGVIDATNMVLDFFATNRHPFIYDTFQLARFLGVSRKEMFRFLRSPHRWYQEIRIPKKSGGERVVHAPDFMLKLMQRRILYGILNHFPISPYATAYHSHAKLKDNAAPHVGKKHLLKMDLAEFFGSIRFDQVYSAVFHSGRFPKQVGAILTALCCKGEYLVQGAPTSPALSNLVLKNFDDNFGAWCKKNGLSYTRYCDDITVSGNTSLYRAYSKAKGMLEDMGFAVNEKKTHFMTNAGRQEVTGLTVNEKVRVSSSYKRALRQELYYAIKFGLPNQVERSKSGVTVSAEERFNQLMGKISYVLSVEPDNGYFRDMRQELIESKYRFDF